MDIDTPYVCLLQRPWVHMAEEALLPSTQGDKSTRNQNDVIVAQTSVTPYGEAGEQSYEYSLQAFEINHATKPKEDTFKALQVMKIYGWIEGQGMGKNAQGMEGILAEGAQSSGFGLGFEATVEDYPILADSRMVTEDNKLGIPLVEEAKGEFPPLNQIFRSAGWVSGKKEQSIEEAGVDTRKVSEFNVCATSEEATGPYPWIRELAAGEELDNWEAYDCDVLMPNTEM
ncbi:hypothetical protein COLO4_28357 [Corchorus olitorius]|uniref:G-patch domain-containing protein n=1 Tax=Corchorus olitorius TaxID=93759 RepID=A0A1R3HL70_9ROSI|nr:hypothetical protein COLO4_28357 [Corchorus olitorius]